MPIDPSLTVVDKGDHLGESPFWDEREGRLVRVDMHKGRLIRMDPQTQHVLEHRFPAPILFAVPASPGRYVIGVGMEVLSVALDGSVSLLADLAAYGEGNRINDAKCDSRGNLWVGTMRTDWEEKPGLADMFRIDPQGNVSKIFGGVTLANGLDWSPSDNLFYHVDTGPNRIDVMSCDIESGTVSDRRVFVEFAPEDGLADGLCVDADGGVWVAMFMGSEVRRYLPNGELDAQIHLPVSCPTSVVFGGEGYGDLFITTSKHRLTAEEARQQPHAGDVFCTNVDVLGQPANHFGQKM